MNKVRAEALDFANTLRMSPVSQITAAHTFVIPPFPYITEVANMLKGTRVRIGAQNMHWDDKGAWTGEVSPLMVRDCGASIVELGHSERRTFFNETDETVALKVKAAVAHGLTALVCVGDTRNEHDTGATANVLARQVRMALKHIGEAAQGKVIIAYEPVWSIGDGGIPADPDFANEQLGKLKALTADLAGTALPILYGGSVNPQNCVALASRSHIDGLFIGRSAWDAAGYIGIVEAVTTSLENSP